MSIIASIMKWYEWRTTKVESEGNTKNANMK